MSAPSWKPDDASASRPSRPSAKPSTANSSSPPARHPLFFSSHDRYQSQPADRIRIVSPCPLPGWAITVDKLLTASAPGSGRWNEFSMMLAAFGLDLPGPFAALIRAAAALGMLALAFVAVARHGRGFGALAVLGLGTGYLLAFNPRTELGSYMNLSALLGVLAGTLLVRGRQRGVAVAAIIVSLALGNHLYGDWIYRPTDVWLKPALDLVVLACFAVWLIMPGNRLTWNGTGRGRAG